MNVPNASLYKDRSAICEQIARHGQAVTQIGQVRMNAIAPGITKRLHLFRLARDVVSVPSFTSRLVVDHWKFELNSIP